jgi:hypothetical protein
MARSFLGAALGVFAGFAGLSSCSSPPASMAYAPSPNPASPDAGGGPGPSREGGISIEVDSGFAPPPEFPACDPARSVSSDSPALLERDPAALAGFSLERVLLRLSETAGGSALPLEMLQRLFDTLNTAAMGAYADNVHCDDAANRAFQNARPAECPRAEGVLATSGALLTPESADSFVPVAIVNRFDQAPQNFPTCGEFRIVFAKRSGRTDARDRLLMIFEGVLPNPSHAMAGCVPVADFWARLPTLASAAERGARLEQFFFEGLPRFGPVIHAKNFGLGSFNCRYESCGRVRLGLGMQEPWDFREFSLSKGTATEAGSPSYFAPAPLNDTPVSGLFDFYGIDPKLVDFRSALRSWAWEVASAPTVTQMRIDVGDFFVAGDSALAGPASPNFLERVRGSDSMNSILSEIDQGLATPAIECPEGDPITHESVFQRITALTCAGCHAPEQLVSPSRRVGCGLVWPNSLGEAHIDEHGTLSDALVHTLLPQRADVLSTYLQACDIDVIRSKFQPPLSFPCFVAGTPITMADGSLKPIEHIAAGDRVLTFDTKRAELTDGVVTHTFVHPDSDDLVVVNGGLVATGNHPFYSGGNWVRADSLAPGSELLAAIDADPTSAVRLEASTDSVRSLAQRDGTATTYNFEVAVHHAYFAGGILVHNKR